MVDRINFIEKKPFSFTYKRLLEGGAGIVGLLLLIYGVQSVRLHFAERKVARLTTELNLLKEEQEKKLATLQQGVSGSVSAQTAVRQFLEEGPFWSKTLKEVVFNMPDDLWLTDLKTYDKESSGSKKAMILNGKSKTAGSVTLFVEKLAASGSFENVFLSSSALEDEGGEGRHVFSIDLNVLKKEGGS